MFYSDPREASPFFGGIRSRNHFWLGAHPILHGRYWQPAVLERMPNVRNAESTTETQIGPALHSRFHLEHLRRIGRRFKSCHRNYRPVQALACARCDEARRAPARGDGHEATPAGAVTLGFAASSYLNHPAPIDSFPTCRTTRSSRPSCQLWHCGMCHARWHSLRRRSPTSRSLASC